MNPDLNVNYKQSSTLLGHHFQYFTEHDHLKQTVLKNEFSFLETKSLSSCVALSGLVTHWRLHTHLNNFQVYVPIVVIITNRSLI